MKSYKKGFTKKELVCLGFLIPALILIGVFLANNCGKTGNLNIDEPTLSSSSLFTDEAGLDTGLPPVYENPLPEGFSYIDPSIMIELKYATSYNFTGAPVPGYEAQVGIMTSEGCAALLEAERIAESMGYKLKVYDAYRPARAVESFMAWVGNNDESMKDIFYPDIDKSELLPEGYISSKSAHSRGSVTDVTLVEINTLSELDMGSYFDLFDPISNFHSDAITPEQQENRNILGEIMEQCGFRYYENEWWHYRLNDEPFPDTYFDFPVK